MLCSVLQWAQHAAQCKYFDMGNMTRAPRSKDTQAFIEIGFWTIHRFKMLARKLRKMCTINMEAPRSSGGMGKSWEGCN